MASRKTYGQDAPIDWSPFEEDAGQGPVQVQGAAALKAISTVLLLLSIVGIIVGAILLKSSLDSGVSGSGIFGALLVMGVAFLTLLPAAFGLQAAQGGSPVPALAFGLIGVLLPFAGILLAVLLGPAALSWLILEVPAIAYLIITMKVRRNAERQRRARSGYASRREELWDEEKIWR